MLDTILTALAPLLSDLLAVALVALFGLIGLAFRRLLGLQGEQIWREALDQALTNGALASDAEDPAQRAREAFDHVVQTMPETIAGLKATDAALMRRAVAKVREIAGR